jgi:predicted DNA-binding transcriptional regulator AlpA
MQRNDSPPFQLQRRFVSEIELEQFTGISRRTWQKRRLFHDAPLYYKIYGSIRYDLEEVLAWIKSHAVGAGTLGQRIVRINANPMTRARSPISGARLTFPG